jgi:hypothetical protein
VEALDETPAVPPDAETAVAGLFAARYPELVRLAALLGADDPEGGRLSRVPPLPGSHLSVKVVFSW